MCFDGVTTQVARDANPNADPSVETRERTDAPTNATFQIKDTILFVPVVTLSTEHDYNFSEQLKSGFKRTIKWNKYRSEITNQTIKLAT